MIRLLDILKKDNNNIFYRLELKNQLEQGKITKSNVEVASNLNELAIIINSWYGEASSKKFQLFKLKGIIENIEKHTYQLNKTKQLISFCNQNNIDWKPDVEEEYIIVSINVPTIKIIQQISIDNSIIENILNNID
jgi:hypothetical protein